MSSISVNTITDASGGATTSINGFTPSVSNMAGRNRIINGDMRISQRGASPTIGGGGDYSVDRFYNYYSGNVYTSVQSTTAPAGFINSLLLTITTASASPTYSFFGQKIEGVNVSDLSWGTSDAKSVTLSFWVRSSVAGIYSLSLGNYDGNRAYPITYTISSANTWQQISLTIPGDTSGAWYTNNFIGIMLRWNMGTASASRLGTSGSWQSANLDGATGSTGSNNWANTSGATFYITGVQLEEGSVATPFEHRQYGQELALCQRYYYKWSTNATVYPFTLQVYNASSAFGKLFDLPVQMRSSPSCVVTGTFYPHNATGGSAGNFTNMTNMKTSTTSISTGAWTGASGLVAGNATGIGALSNATITVDAEL